MVISAPAEDPHPSIVEERERDAIGEGPSTIRAAVIDYPGASPRVVEVAAAARPVGRTRVRVLAAAINPLDIGMASGAAAVRHETAYVPGIECAGVVIESEGYQIGDLVYAQCHASPDNPGCLATQVVVSDDDVIRLPDGIDPERAVAVGNCGVAAYLPLIDVGALKQGESVLILGATGAVGTLGVQIARQHGAEHVVAVGRNSAGLRRAMDLGADAVVELRQGDTEDALADRLAAASPQINVVLDGLFGMPLQAALRVCAPGARVVNIGNPAGPAISLHGNVLRARQLTVTGFAGYYTPLSQKRVALEWLWAQLVRDQLAIETRTWPLSELPQAWQEQQAPLHSRTIIVPETSPHRTG